MSVRIIDIEGLIGAGKSTAARKLAGRLEFRAFHEPVEADYLDKFYQDPKGMAFEFQMRQVARRIWIHKAAVAEPYLGEYKGSIIDRGIIGDRVFAKMHYQAGNISPEQWATYELLFDDAIHRIRPPALLLFFDVDPSVALERVKNRNRGAESTMDLTYLTDLRKGYLDLLSEVESREHSWSNGLSVKRIPWNADNQDIGPIAEMVKDELRL